MVLQKEKKHLKRTKTEGGVWRRRGGGGGGERREEEMLYVILQICVQLDPLVKHGHPHHIRNSTSKGNNPANLLWCEFNRSVSAAFRV